MVISMSFKKKIEEMILSRSNSYQFYKEQYESNKSDNIALEQQLNQMKQELDSFKRTTDNQMESMAYLFRTVFFDYQINEPINALKYIHDLSAELLFFVSRICKDNEINWWLDFKTLLGAILNENFIPWDDEIDVGMMRSDFLKFEEIFKKEIINNELTDIIELKFINSGQNSKSIKGSLQICVNHPNYDLPSLSVLNVFVYDYKGEYVKKILKKEYKKCKKSFLDNLDNNPDIKSYYEILGLSYEPDDFIIPGIDRMEYDEDFYIFTTSRVFPLKKVKFGDNEYYAPHDDRHYLKKLYTDYFKIPTVISIPENVDKFRYTFDSPIVFEECINRLKEVNKNS